MRLQLAAGITTVTILISPPAGGADPVAAPKPAEMAGSSDVPTVEDLLAEAGTAEIAVIVLPDDGSFPVPPVKATRTIRYVMVRGVWPSEPGRGSPAVTPIDFELERQAVGPRRVQGGPDWERVDLESVQKLLEASAGFVDTGNADALHAVISVPLPVRTDGGWGDEASHPKLKQMEAGELLLFRCLDLDLGPGDAYRYRVRFKVAGPGYAVPRTGTSRLGFDAGPRRWTPWSDPTEPVTVEP